MAIITLMTDFGIDSPYVAEMKGVLLTADPTLRIVDISHAIEPQNVRQGAYVVRQVSPRFPVGTIHVVVVDPGVGTQRRLLLCEADGHVFVGPDNGVLSWVLAARASVLVWKLDRSEFWSHSVSATFHGRDIMAPVAAALAAGVAPAKLGTPVDQWIVLEWPQPSIDLRQRTLCGQIVHVDSYGNLVTNIHGDDIARMASGINGYSVDVSIDEHESPSSLRQPEAIAWVGSYGHAPPGALVGLVGSGGWVEIACVNGSAARALQVGVQACDAMPSIGVRIVRDER